VKDEYRTRAFLSQDQVDARVLQDLGINAIEEELLTEIAPLDESLELTDRILQANRESPSLDALRAQASAESGSLPLRRDFCSIQAG